MQKNNFEHLFQKLKKFIQNILQFHLKINIIIIINK